jgi:hypothetical protein
MDDKPKDRPSRAAKRAAINLINTTKRSASTHKRSGRTKKARKTTPSAPSARVDKGVEDVSIQFHKAPATECQTSYTSSIISASDMQKQIAAEAHRVSRKNIPWDKFRSMYLCGFSVKARRKLVVKSIKKIGEGNWEEQLFRDRLRQSLSDEVRYSRYAFIRLADLPNRFFVTLSYSMEVPRPYPMLTKIRRYLLSPISFSTSVKSLLYGQMWSFYSNMRGAVDKKRSPGNSRSGCVMLGMCSIINLSAVTSMGSCLHSLVPMSATLITVAPSTQSLSISRRILTILNF